MNTKRVAFIIFSDPMIFPPTMNAASILAKKGIQVDIYGLHYNTGDYIKPAKGVNIKYCGSLRKGLKFRMDFIIFCFRMIFFAKKTNYDWIFSYNMTGVLPGFLAAKFSGAKWLYHNHDLTPVTKTWSFYGLLKYVERWASRRADLVVFPQKMRAELFSKEARLNVFPLIVGNGPCKEWIDVDGYDEDVVRLKKDCGLIVIYQGGLNWMRGLHKVIASMPYWDKPAGLLLVGGTELQPSFPNEALSLAQEVGVERRLLIRPTEPYLELPKLTKLCDIGLGVMATDLDDSCTNIKYLAGASNKLSEYMACGLPVVVPNSEEYRELISAKKVGVLTNNNSPLEVAKGINTLLNSDKVRGNMSKRALDYFNDELNYESQFQVVLEKILN